MRLMIPVFVTRTGCAKTAERIDLLFRMETPGEPRNIVLNGGTHPLMARGRGFDADFDKLIWPLVRLAVDKTAGLYQDYNSKHESEERFEGYNVRRRRMSKSASTSSHKMEPQQLVLSTNISLFVYLRSLVCTPPTGAVLVAVLYRTVAA